jgi:hypothetical protein
MDGAPKKGKSQHKPVKDQRDKQGVKKNGRIVTAGKLKHKWAFR